MNSAIADVIVPIAIGNPAPTYAAVGALPAGITFTPGSRTLAFDESSIVQGSGTIRIRATNSEGSDDWTVAYTFLAPLAAPNFAVDTGTAINVNVGTAVADIIVPVATGIPAPSYAAVGNLPAGVTFTPGSRTLAFDESTIVAGSGTITIRASNSQGSDDWTIAYAFAALVAPVFSPDAGTAIRSNVGDAIANVVVPAATGNPAPTYAAVGTLPTGVTFTPGTLTLSFARATIAAGTGTITIRATNSEGSDDWTVEYAFLAAAAPLFSPDTGTRIEGVLRRRIPDVLVPPATGLPAPTYTIRGSFPRGVTFDPNTRMISFDRTAIRAGSGTLRIRAVNSHGADIWRVPYTFAAASAPHFLNSSINLTSNVGSPIADIIVRVASGFPTPSYAAVGALPTGVTFTPGTRTLSFDEMVIKVGSGTITIRATNSEGTADQTIAYTFLPPLTAPVFAESSGTPVVLAVRSETSIVVPLPRATGNPTPRQLLVGSLPDGVSLTQDGSLHFFRRIEPPTSGTIILRATNSEGTADWTLMYTFLAEITIPTFSAVLGDPIFGQRGQRIPDHPVPAATGNPAPTYTVNRGLPAGVTFDADRLILSFDENAIEPGEGRISIRASNIAGGNNINFLYEFIDGPINAPHFEDDTGTPIRVPAGRAIADVIVPESHRLGPFYAVVGTLPAGVTFTPGTRTLSFDETAIKQGSGIITIRATNTKGSDDWTIAYTFLPPLTAPVFTNATGMPIRTIAGLPVANVIVPRPSGNPAPVYAAIRTLPPGVTFTSGTRTLSFGELDLRPGTGTITIRATNSQGSDDWTVAYTFMRAPVVVPEDASIITIGSNGDSAFYRINPHNPDDNEGLYGKLGDYPSTLRTLSALSSFEQVWYGLDAVGRALWTIDLDDPENDSAQIGTLPITLTQPHGMGIDEDGVALVLDDAGDELWRIDLSDPDNTAGDFGLVGTLPTALSSPTGLTWAGPVLSWLAVNAADSSVWRIDPSDPDNTTPPFGRLGALPAGLQGPSAITYDFDNEALFVASSTTHDLWRINLDDTDDTTFPYGHVDSLPTGVMSPMAMGYATPPRTAPAFPSTGPVMRLIGLVGSRIAPYQIPAGGGVPGPRYVVSGLPDGVTFDSVTRILTFSRNVQPGEGEIVVAAFNSAGSSTWVIPYRFVRAGRAPSINVAAHEELLLPQYDGSENLHRLVQELTAVLQERIIDPLLLLERGLNPDESSLILLDWIGQRLGFPRPRVASEDAEYWGFEGTRAAGGRTFGQAPFFSVQRGIEQVEPLGDTRYRVLLKARASRLRGGANRENIEQVLQILFGNGYIDEGQTPIRCVVRSPDAVIRSIVTEQFDRLIPRPAGTAMELMVT